MFLKYETYEQEGKDNLARNMFMSRSSQTLIVAF